MPDPTAFWTTFTIPVTGAASPGYNAGGHLPYSVVPTSVLFPASLLGTTRIKFQVSRDNSTFYDVLSDTSVIYLTGTISSVVPVPDVIRQNLVGWDYIRIVSMDAANANKTPSSAFVLTVTLLAIDADTPSFADPHQALPAGSALLGTVGIDQTTPGTTNGVVVNKGPSDRTPAHTVATATNATSAMLAANAGRLAALIINDGSVDIYIKLGAAAVASQGIRIGANGGAFAMSDMLGNLDTAAINGITASGSANVIVTEWAA